MERKRMHATVHGRVQRVAFREHTRREAERLGLSGWVRNLPDGTVEVVFAGAPEKVDLLLSWLAVGSPFSRVDQVDYNEEKPQGETGPFVIRYSA